MRPSRIFAWNIDTWSWISRYTVQYHPCYPYKGWGEMLRRYPWDFPEHQCSAVRLRGPVLDPGIQYPPFIELPEDNGANINCKDATGIKTAGLQITPQNQSPTETQVKPNWRTGLGVPMTTDLCSSRRKKHSSSRHSSTVSHTPRMVPEPDKRQHQQHQNKCYVTPAVPYPSRSHQVDQMIELP